MKLYLKEVFVPIEYTSKKEVLKVCIYLSISPTTFPFLSIEGHTACSHCSAQLNRCPLCASHCSEERKVNFTLQDLVQASRNGDLCPQIPPRSFLEKGLRKEVSLLYTLLNDSISPWPSKWCL
ncbi:hypothetical protein GEMRC1_001174 [Eukaryota sp. GEM-RC1]